jgi:bifunctional non-homologous end joining protein LigD
MFGVMSASRELQRQLRRIEPCLPRAAKAPPAGPGWIHEIKHDGYRIMAERDHGSVRLYTRNGYDFAERFPLAAAAIRKLPVRSCLIDGEAIVCDANGLAVFDLLRRWAGDDVVLCAFDLLELDGHDLRRAPIEERKATLASCCAGRSTALPSTNTTAATVRSSSRTPARSAVRALYRSG